MRRFFESYFVEISIGFIALVLVLLRPDRAYLGISYAVKMYLSFFPVILSVAFLAGLISELLSPELVKKIVGRDSGFKGMLIGAIFGALMVGPAYVFYPLFKELMDKGASVGVIATTIGAWAIRLQAIPLAGAMLGFKFITLFNSLIFLYALISGLIVGLLCERD